MTYDTALLNEREKTHGDFAENARLAQALKDVFKSAYNYHTFEPYIKEALDCKAGKLARALQNPYFKDHWLDDSGYSMLVAERCNGQHI